MSVIVLNALEREHRAMALELRRCHARIAESRDVVGTARLMDGEINRLRSALTALEESISRFDPDWRSVDNPVIIHTKHSPFPRGRLRTSIFEIFREAGRPLTKAEIYEILAMSYVAGDMTRNVRNSVRVSLGAQLERDEKKGILRRSGDPAQWEIVPKSERPSTMGLAPASTAASAS